MRRSPFSLLNDLRQKPQRLGTASKYTALNGIGYLAIGAILIAWPGAIQIVFREPPFAGHEQALMRVVGLTVVVIGWLSSLVVARERDNSLLLPSSTDWSSSRRYWFLSPLLVCFLAVFLTFTIVDALLAVGAWTLLARK